MSATFWIQQTRNAQLVLRQSKRLLQILPVASSVHGVHVHQVGPDGVHHRLKCHPITPAGPKVLHLNPMMPGRDDSRQLDVSIHTHGHRQTEEPGVTYLAAVHCTHLSSALLALPWNFTTFLFMGGLPVSELARLSTDELLLDRAWRAGRLLVNSSICDKRTTTG